MAAPRLTLALVFALFSPWAAFADSDVCSLDPAGAPDKIDYFEGVVVGVATDAEVLAQTRVAIGRARAPVSPPYVKLPRIVAIFRDSSGLAHQTIAAVLSGPLPQPQAHVTLASRHRDPNAACAFIPWTVVGPGGAV